MSTSAHPKPPWPARTGSLRCSLLASLLAASLGTSLPATAAPQVPARSQRPTSEAATQALPAPVAVPPASPHLPGAVVPLTLGAALQLALETPFAVQVADERVHEATAHERGSEAPLRPHLSLGVLQQNLTTNLASLGFKPGLFGLRSTVIGPFGRFDARLAATQALYLPEAEERARASHALTERARLQARLMREQVAAGVHLAYLAGLRSDLGLSAAQADLELARALARLATDQHRLGLGTGLDVTRAQARTSFCEAHLAAAERARQQAHLQLCRLLGKPLGTFPLLAGSLQPAGEALPNEADALHTAGQQRLEVQVLRQQLAAGQHLVRAAQAVGAPRVSLMADYGVSGNTPLTNAQPTHTVSLGVELPLLDGGKARAETAAARSHLRQDALQLDDMLAQIEQDVRSAYLELTSAGAQVSSATRGLELAERELKMSRDRFKAGLADNLEVVQAQATLTEARDLHLAALCLQQAARINLAAAMGQASTYRW